MAGDKTYITDQQGKQHRATRVHAVTPTNIVWSSNPNDYAVQVLIDGKWHRAILTYDVSGASYFDNVNIDKALVVGADGKNHTALIVSSEAAVTLSSIKTDEHALVNGTTTGETAVCTYTEAWGNIEWEDNVNVYKVIVTGSDGKKHTALLTTGASGGGVQAIVLGVAPLTLPNALATSIVSLIAYGGTLQGVPDGYTQLGYIESTGTQYIDLGIKGNENTKVSVEFRYHTASSATGSGRVFGSRTNSTNNAFAIGSSSGVVGATGNKVFWCYDAQAFFVIDDSPFPVGDWQTVVFSATEHTLNGVSYGDDYNVVEFETPQNLKLFGFDNNGTMGYGLVDIARCKVWDNGVLIRDLVPCKNASNVIGMYDLVNGVFYQNAGTGDFVAGPNTVPTPTAPIDIVCNNGALKARHESGLPLGYTLLDYAVFNGTQVVDTGLRISTNDEIRSKLRATATGFAYGADTSNPRITLYMSSGGNQRWGTGLSSTSGVPPLNTELTVIQNKTSISYNGTDYSMSATDDFTTINTLTIGNCNGNTSTPKFSGNFYYAEIYQGGLLVAKMVPVKASDDTVGFYDLVRNQFFAPSTGTLVAGSTVSDPVEIYTTGPVETIATKDSNSSTVSTATTEMLLSVDTYTDQQEVIGGSITRKCGVVILDSSFEWTYDGAYGRVNATIPNLWGSTVARTVPGFCTHFKWLSHQESISSITAGQCYSAGANRIFLHISQTSAAAFSAWLDAQKAAGTPVIIVFPLENATTDTVAEQPMATAAGDNTAEITQAGMAGLELEVEYMKQA